MLKICPSGRVAFVSAAPPCADHSMVRERPGGPPPVRNAENMLGFPDMSEKQQSALQMSHSVHEVVSRCLLTVWELGGHFGWENPPSSLAVLEEGTTDLFRVTNCTFVRVPACSVGWDIAKAL